MARRWKSFLLMAVLVAVGYYVIASRIDWWLYYLNANQAKRDTASLTDRVKATGLQFVHLADLQYKNESVPLLAMTLIRPQAAKAACIFAGVHGNEPAGTEAALAFAADLGRNASRYPDMSFYIVPVANPWGWAHDLRHNGDNIDIARSFAGRTTAEAAAIKQLLAIANCDLVVDLHEDRIHSGFYMLTYENGDTRTAASIAAEAAKTGVPLGGDAHSGLYHIRAADFAGVSRPTLAMYARQRGCPSSYIVETSARLPLEQRVALHRLALDHLLKALQDRVTAPRS
jgi:hypothetical protein